MPDKIQNIQKGREAGLNHGTSRRRFLGLGLAAAGATVVNLVDLDGMQVGVQVLKSGVAIASNIRTQRVAAAKASSDCGPLPTDGRPPLCTTTEEDIFGQSYFGGFYFDDKDGDGRFNPRAGDTPVQGVKDRQLLVEEIGFTGWGDFVQLNPNSRTVRPDGRVSYMDVKAGNNSGEKFVDRWTIFKIPSDGGTGIGLDLRTGLNRLIVAVSAESTVDKVWAPVDDEKRFNRHECSGNCGWNCVRFIQFSRLKAGAQVDLSGIVPNDSIHRDPKSNLLSSYTDYLWLWESQALSDGHIDYNRINTPLTDALRRSEGVVQSTVFIPRDTAPYENYSR